DRDQLDEGRRRARAALDRFAVLDGANWRDRPAVRHLAEAEREQLPGAVGELLLLLATDQEEGALDLNESALACFPPGEAPRALWEQRAGLLDNDTRQWATRLHPAPDSTPGLVRYAAERGVEQPGDADFYRLKAPTDARSLSVLVWPRAGAAGLTVTV